MGKEKREYRKENKEQWEERNKKEEKNRKEKSKQTGEENTGKKNGRGNDRQRDGEKRGQRDEANMEITQQRIEKEKWKEEQIKEEGGTLLSENSQKHKIQLVTIIGEIEGHDILGNSTKSTKYEHILPILASIEDSNEIEGVLILLNTMGGDVEAGLAIAEMIASLSKPTVSLVLGGSHSIGVPIAVSSQYSYIVPTGTMVIHPVRLSGLVIGAQPTFDYFRQMQNRIIHFVSSHCGISGERMEELMMETGMLTKDVGTILVGKEAVEEGIINEVGGIAQAVQKLHEMIGKS